MNPLIMGYVNNNTLVSTNKTRQVSFGKTSSRDEKKMYSAIEKMVDREGKAYLKNLDKNKKLYSKDSSDGTSTLENLYKIAKQPRLDRFDRRNILKQTLKTLDDPYKITQNVGRIPDLYLNFNNTLEKENSKLLSRIQQAQTKPHFNPDNIGDVYPIKPENVVGIHGATCSAASMEFNMAHRKPAEFARYVEGLTSPEKCVKTPVKYSDLSPDMLEALTALVNQNSNFKALDWENVEVAIKPDENAYLRADVQEDYRQQNTRSLVDVLMQSAFMQLGSRATYNSLTDRRSIDVGDGGGLNQFEIAFVESIVDSKSKKIPMVYMELDEELTKVTKYSHKFEDVKNQFIKALDSGTNIITGFLVDVDGNGNVITPQGHEILITGYERDEKGKLWFKHNDTDDGAHFAPSWIEADSFIPKIHHANVPQCALKEKPQYVNIGYLYLQDYKNFQNENQTVS